MTGWTRILFWGFTGVVLGWAVFVRCWGLADRPFWQDEAWVADAVTHQTWGRLFRQTELPMPPLFAVATRAIGTIVSPPEVGLRLLPALCGIGCVPLSYVAVRALRVPRTVALAGVAACASSPMLVIWSREAKQYEVEALLALLLAVLVFRVRRCAPERARWPAAVGIALLGVVGPWLGYGFVLPAVTLMGILIALPPLAPGARRHGQLVTGLVGLGALLVSVLIVRQFAAAKQASEPALIEFTRHWFIDPTSLRSWLRAGGYASWSTSMLLFPQTWVENVFVAGLAAAVIWLAALLGLCTWPRRSRIDAICWTLGPWFVMLVAAIARQYPFAVPRMMVFAAAPMVLAVTMGLVRICRGFSIAFLGHGGPGMMVALLLTLVPITYMIRVPTGHRYAPQHDFPAVIRVLENERRSGELVIVTLNAVPSVRYYAPDMREPLLYYAVGAGVAPVPGFDYASLARNAVRRAGARCWVLSTGRVDDSYRTALLQAMQRAGYELHLAAEAGNRDVYGIAELLTATRKSYR